MRENPRSNGAIVAKNQDFHRGRGPGRGAPGGRDRGQGARGPEAPNDRSRASDPNISLIWGFHAVREALRSTRRKLVRLHATEAAAARLADDITARRVELRIATPQEIEARAPHDSIHQGVLLEARPLGPIALEDLPANGLVLVLDQVTDPHNVGAILRTAAAYCVDAVVVTERHSPSLTGVLAKSASGALEHVPICHVVNLARAMEELADMGYARVGLDSEGSANLADVELTRPMALALGAEGKGLRRLTRENCDVVARLDLPGPIKSLNVSNACAVALTLVAMKLPKA